MCYINYFLPFSKHSPHRTCMAGEISKDNHPFHLVSIKTSPLENVKIIILEHNTNIKQH